MRQGRASGSAGAGKRKVEPSANGIHPGYAGQLGESQGSHVTGEKDSSYRGESMRCGPGYAAPKNKSQTTAKGGSQGSY
jgi:hypothetical protein